jgi:hypothetical protein
MKAKVTYIAELNMRLRRDMVEHLIVCARSHYDSTCKHAARPGPSGFIHGWKMMMGRDEWVEVYCSASQLNLICKILESPRADPAIAGLFYRAFRAQQQAQLEAPTKEVDLDL